MHQALQSSCSVSPDIYPEVFDWFFVDEVFTAWRDVPKGWQLHCIGGPGSGKTTLTALVARHLRAHPKARQQPIVTVFIDQDVANHDLYFIEDFLDTLYHAFGDGKILEEDQSDDLHKQYKTARDKVVEGTRFRQRLVLIRKALHSRLRSLNSSRAFLVFDGIDQCDSTLRVLLEHELSDLQEEGLSILLTSRVAVFEQREATCDHLNHRGYPDDDPLTRDEREALITWLKCRKCNRVLCFDCQSAGRVCGACHNNINLHEPYDHVNIRISVPDEAMKRYIAWDLEREHGELGLGSPCLKPPLSPLGKSLTSNKVLKSVQKHADDVLEFSYAHIGMAKARLDLLHGMESLESLEMRRDQLPANIVTMFDAALKRMEAQEAGQTGLGLKALAISASSDDGVAIPDLLRTQSKVLGAVGVRSGEEILEATRGLLFATTWDNPQKLAVFNQNLLYYIKERYRQSIHNATIQISDVRTRFEPQELPDTPTSVTRDKIERSMTGLERISEGPDQPFIIRKGTRVWR